ncbi:hypothetical protein [Burkholderia ubonensis]|uniref:hypothetical protein n=1 Tax=Burkholderia ubonensis TaxID=101571 RepID=UPI000B183F25|nr:hypothetical protein [Burkholderia ubonensis]
MPISEINSAILHRSPSIGNEELALESRDPIQDEINEIMNGKSALVFSGFSGLGYKDPKNLEVMLRRALESAIEKYGPHIVVVAGATDCGIGVVYRIAQEYGLSTLGIVSEMAKNSGELISPYCKHVVYVPDPDGSWKVEGKSGLSYMVGVVKNNDGEFHAYGGGDVTKNELEQARNLGIKTEILTEFDPDPAKAAARLIKNPSQDLTPVRTAYQEALKEPFTYSAGYNDRELAEQIIRLNADAKIQEAIRERKSKVHFNPVVQVSDTFGGNRKTGERLSMIEKEFRREVDREAKKHNLGWAEGHTDWKEHWPFSLDRARAASAAD